MATKIRKIRYLVCSTICHGKCEEVLVLQIQSKNRIQLHPVSDKNGKKSIMINTLNNFLNTHYKTRNDYIKANTDLINHDKKRMFDHKIFAIMDKDDAAEKAFENYKNKTMFSEYWWGKEDYIYPIYFNPDMDTVFNKHGFKIDISRDKPSQYLRLLTTNYQKVIEMLVSLPKKESNIGEFIDYINKHKN